jgi:hypothetical protein
MLGALTLHAGAQEMEGPRLLHGHADWNAAAADLETLRQLSLAVPLEGPAAPTKPLPTSIEGLNEVTGELVAKIATSPVPVLMPFDTAAYLRDRAADMAKPADQYMSGFHLSPFFLPGPSGYDALFTTRAGEMTGLGLGFSGRIDVFISGLATYYDLDEPTGMIEWPTNGLQTDIPGLRRLFLENYVRYTFTRYGVPYVVSILCFDGGHSRYHMIDCPDAAKVAARFIRALNLVGGAPQSSRVAAETTGATIDRPAAASADFTYRSPGAIIPGTGMRGRGGRSDYTVYSKMRFPIADAPAFANSQAFMNWGNCDMTGRIGLGMLGRTPAYRCRVGGSELVMDESAGGNYAYPWRDNFCEHRYFDVGQCPAGLGHQGQDIRPGSCKQRIEGANRCEPYQHDVAAVRDGMVVRAPGEMPVYLVVNAQDEHVRFRYLHMSPKQLDQDGVLTGRTLQEGERFGKVGNYFQHERATSYHLHFDMQVPTKYGWVFVDPYMTLVASYERLIGGRGTEIKEEPLVATVPLPPERFTASTGSAAAAAAALENAVQSEGDDRVEAPSNAVAEQPEQVVPFPPRPPASVILWRRTHLAGTGADGTEHPAVIRPVGGGFSRESRGARNIRHDVYASHARPKAGRHRL